MQFFDFRTANGFGDFVWAFAMTLIRKSHVPILSIQLSFAFLFFLGATLPGTVLLGQQKAPPSQQAQSQAPQSPLSKPQGPQLSNASSPPNSHVVAVTFDYDFTKVPACSPTVTAKNCIKQFDVYDITAGHLKIFSIPTPAGASGVVKGIPGQSPRRVFEPGPHILAVTAESAAGTESEVTGSTTTVVIPTQTSVPANFSPH